MVKPICKFSFRNIFIILLLASNLLYGQNFEIVSTKSNLEVSADSLFNMGRYKEALPEYTKLVIQYPQDPEINYKLGVCYFKSTRDLPKAIEYLKFASTQQVTNMVYFYLAEAHLHSYLFDDAISYYRRFTVNGGSPEVPLQLVERRVGQCENGNFMIRFIYEVKVIDKKKVSQNDMHRYINTKSSKGNFVPKPNDLKTAIDKKQGDASIIYYPNNPQPGDKIFYSSYGSTTSFGKDIFTIEFQADGFWSKPKNLGNVINSSFDDDFPYLAEDGITLYFASKGHYSMGGYDIYRSIFNPTTKQWSSPENLGFPFSSPYDDFQFVPNAENSMGTFISNRGFADDNVEVVLIEIDENPIRRPFDNIEAVRKIALLNVFDSQAIDQYQIVKPQASTEKKLQQKSATFDAVENDPEYSRALTQGFAQQMRADSLRIKLEALRQKFDFISTADERRALEKQVVKVEDDLLEAQKNADNFFARASQIEQEYITGKRKPMDVQSSTFASDNPQFLYQAQFAPTVFQVDELNRLAQLEKLTPQIDAQRRDIIALKDKLNEIENLEPEFYNENPEYKKTKNDWLSKLKSFNTLLANHAGGKKALYRECISVAMVKRGASSDAEIRGEVDRANLHFRSATAIRNNATTEELVQSEYEALLLDEMGVLRLELAFSKLWGIKLFEQEVKSKIYRLEQNIFGRPLPSASIQKQPSSKTEVVQQPTTPEVSITREDEKTIEVEAILFHPDKEPDFQIIDKSPYDKNNPIPVDNPFPSGVIYRIQVSALSNPVPIDFFKGMVPINGEKVSGGKVTKYYVGNFTLLSEAEKALPTVRSRGFKDAFIVAWHNGRTVALTRAKILESVEVPADGSTQPSISISQENKLYMVQLGQYKGRLPDDITQTVRALAPGKDIVRKPDNQGNFIYSVGSFSDQVEATRVKDNLIASGIKNAFVVVVELDN